MNNDISNLNLLSNIYIVKLSENKIDFCENSEFISNIYDRKALRRLVDIVQPGVLDDSRRVQHAKQIPGVSHQQAERLAKPDTCINAPRDEEPWGITVNNGHIEYVCKCRQIECRYHSECISNEK